MESIKLVRFLTNYARRKRVEIASARVLERGFTLIEMLVVLAIMVVLTAIVLTSQTSFNQSILLTNSAYDLAIELRQAESYGISSRSFLYQATLTTNAGYGVDFSSAAPTGYTFFADIYGGVASPSPLAKPGNDKFDASQGEAISTATFTRGVFIRQLCGTSGGSVTLVCSTKAQSSVVDVVFTRPNTDTSIVQKRNGVYTNLTTFVIYIDSPQGGERCVKVSDVGQVSVLNTCP